MKVVVDTNVIYAAFVSTEGTCARLLEGLIEAHAMVVSEYILAELREHLSAKRGLPAELVDRQITFLVASSDVVRPAPVHEDACPDPDDLPVLGTLLAADADCLVTGDKALLKMKAFSGHPILSPRAFLEGLPPDAGLSGQ